MNDMRYTDRSVLEKFVKKAETTELGQTAMLIPDLSAAVVVIANILLKDQMICQISPNETDDHFYLMGSCGDLDGKQPLTKEAEQQKRKYDNFEKGE
jgi:hypothetical protein